MKIFNAIQIVSALATASIWLPLLHAATFTGASFLFWIGAVVVAIFFVWAIAGVAETMGE